jgi:hypothetical protein
MAKELEGKVAVVDVDQPHSICSRRMFAGAP